MPTWKLLSGDDEDHHRWIEDNRKRLRGGDGGGEGLVIFRSGFGRSVALKRTSIVKAMSLLGDEEDAASASARHHHLWDQQPNPPVAHDRSKIRFQQNLTIERFALDKPGYRSARSAASSAPSHHPKTTSPHHPSNHRFRSAANCCEQNILRCSNIIEGIKMDFQRGNGVSYNGHDQAYGEGAKIMKMLDGAAEPEVIMAEMTSEQLASFAAYKLKVEETKQMDLNNSIQKALSAAGLTNRAVTPFMRIRVVGLVNKREPKVGGPEEGLITLWNPTEQQRLDLSEGEAYAISGLVPLYRSLNLIYLQARASTIRWQSLTSSEREVFMPFSNPRESILLSRLREIPVSREFDTVALVLHVGDVYIAAHQKRQWVFVTDGSIPERQFSDSTSSLLAISFCAPCIEGDSDLQVNYNLVNSVVGFLNLVMREKDQLNDLWVAEASENSTYHLKHSSLSVQRWVKNSSSTIEILKKKVLNIIGASSH
ncbi:BREAST CANCER SUSCEPTIBILITY 2 homolog B-like protein [Drosera capensis]